MRLLDLYCGAGGAGMGYARAGFTVTGIDVRDQPSYPFEFVQADALEYLELHGSEFDAIHASPPCQPYSTGVRTHSSPYSHTKGKDEPALIQATYDALVALGRPWVIENVMGARPNMPNLPVLLCGSMFGLRIPRHRMFTSSWWLATPPHPTCSGLAKRSADELGWDHRDMSVTGKGRRAGTSERWAALLGIDWPVSQHQLAEAIPPAYTEFIGTQLMEEVR